MSVAGLSRKRPVGVASQARDAHSIGRTVPPFNSAVLYDRFFVHSKGVRWNMSPTVHEEKHVVDQLAVDAHKESFP